MALQGYHGTVWDPISLCATCRRWAGRAASRRAASTYSRELLLLLLLLSLLLEGGDIPSAFAPVRKWRRAFMAAVVVVLVVS